MLGEEDLVLLEGRAELEAGARFPTPAPARLIARRNSQGGLGRLGLDLAWRRWRAIERWCERERDRFDRALTRLAGRQAG